MPQLAAEVAARKSVQVPAAAELTLQVVSPAAGLARGAFVAAAEQLEPVSPEFAALAESVALPRLAAERPVSESVVEPRGRLVSFAEQAVASAA